MSTPSSPPIFFVRRIVCADDALVAVLLPRCFRWIVAYAPAPPCSARCCCHTHCAIAATGLCPPSLSGYCCCRTFVALLLASASIPAVMEARDRCEEVGS
uniref:Uncharacterized protein n=1 Tax=Oryza sativa subsp. japonica TaxID=39947 RepID=Q84Z34_ORYSJ|nr:hypothetical protein [Oryza sativa Japonica Group]BAD31312.1 hypothetical protein [Oryza sativa Japonica Group]